MNNIEEFTVPIVQYPTDLIFAVLCEDVSDQLTILKTYQIDCDGYAIKFSIIGESHCVSVIDDGEIVLQEVLACTDIPAILQAQSHKFAKLETYQFRQQNFQSRIWFSQQFENHPWQSDGKIHLDFPKMFGEVPFTEIAWRIGEREIEWRTTHVYPLETDTTFVYSESLFTLNERSKNE